MSSSLICRVGSGNAQEVSLLLDDTDTALPPQGS